MLQSKQVIFPLSKSLPFHFAIQKEILPPSKSLLFLSLHFLPSKHTLEEFDVARRVNSRRGGIVFLQALEKPRFQMQTQYHRGNIGVQHGLVLPL